MVMDPVCFHLRTKVHVESNKLAGVDSQVFITRSSFPLNSNMATPPSAPPLCVLLQVLKSEFELTDEQLAALPPLDEVDLASQSDSRLIEHAQPGVFTYHPYKLFIGEYKNDPFHAYLTRRGLRKQYQIELCSVDTKNRTHFEPMAATWYGTVNNLAYPFNTFLGTARFVAVVKWYFLLAFRAGEFHEDPGFSVTASWCKDLQGACDELIAAPGREEGRKLKELEKRTADMKRAVERERRKSQDAAKQQTTEFQKTSATWSESKMEVDDRPRGSSTRKAPALATDHEGDKEKNGRRLRQFADRRAVYPPRAFHPHDQVLGPAPFQPWPEVGNLNDPRRRRDPAPRGLERSAPQIPYLRDAGLPRYEQPKRDERRSTNATFTSTAIPSQDFRRRDEQVAKKKSHFIKEGIIPTEERPTQRRKSAHATEANKLDVLDGSAEGNDNGDDTATMSWTQEVERLTSTEEDEVEDKMEDGMKKDKTEPTSDDNQRALREKEWMRLFRQKVEIARQMR